MTVHNQTKKRVGEIYPNSWIWAGLTFLIFFDPSRIAGSKSTCRCFAMHRGEQYSKPDVNLWAKDLTTFLSLWWFFHMTFFCVHLTDGVCDVKWNLLSWAFGRLALNQGCSPFCWNAHLPVSSDEMLKQTRNHLSYQKRGHMRNTATHSPHNTRTKPKHFLASRVVLSDFNKEPTTFQQLSPVKHNANTHDWSGHASSLVE